MHDLRKHSLEEYEQVYQAELAILKEEFGSKDDLQEQAQNSRALTKKYFKQEPLTTLVDSTETQTIIEKEVMPWLYGQMLECDEELKDLDPKEKKKLKKKQKKREKKIKQ